MTFDIGHPDGHAPEGDDRRNMAGLRQTLVLRVAEKRDSRLIHAWRNHPSVRLQSFNTEEIPLDVHERWFQETLERADRFLLIAQQGDVPIGVIRYDLLDERGEEAEVNIYLSPDMQGQGLGGRLLEEGQRWMAENTSVQSVRARVRYGNEASMRMFRKHRFEEVLVEFRKMLGRKG